MRRLVVLVLLLVPAVALAEPLSVAVVPFSARGVDADLALAATDVLETVLAESGQVVTVERAQVEKAVRSVTITGKDGKKLLGVEESLGETVGGDVLRRIADQTGARYLLVGSVSELGRTRSINARLSDVGSGQVLVAKSLSFRDRSDMNGAVRTLAALLLDKLTAGPGTQGTVVDASQRALEEQLARALRDRYCGMDARRAGSVESFTAGELLVRLSRKGPKADDTFEVVGRGGEVKGLFTLTRLERDAKKARGTFVNDGDLLALPEAGDVLRRAPVKLALVPLVAQVALGRDPVDLAQSVEDRLSEEDGCEWVHQDAKAVAAYQKSKAAQRARLARDGVTQVVEWSLELSGTSRRVLAKAFRVPGGKLDDEFTIALRESE